MTAAVGMIVHRPRKAGAIVMSVGGSVLAPAVLRSAPAPLAAQPSWGTGWRGLCAVFLGEIRMWADTSAGSVPTQAG